MVAGWGPAAPSPIASGFDRDLVFLPQMGIYGFAVSGCVITTLVALYDFLLRASSSFSFLRWVCERFPRGSVNCPESATVPD